MNKLINVALGSVPKDSGTFTFYRNLRPALEQYGVRLYCVALGRAQAQLWEEEYADSNTILLAPHTHNVKKQAKIFTGWCSSMGIDIVMGINSEGILSSFPHLPRKIRVVSRCANAFDHGYRITLSGGIRLQAIFVITPRLQADLIEKYNADASLMHLIPNGVDAMPFDNVIKHKNLDRDVIELGFLGRLEDTQKGVMHLPRIVHELSLLGVPFHLRIAGKGIDKNRLEEALEPWIIKGHVSFVGALNSEKVPLFLKSVDVFIFPSHFEGCPNALLEAMMAGCVTVSWIIEGITDYIINEGVSGFLHKMGDHRGMASTIKMLYDNPTKLQELGNNAAQEARLRFDPELIAKHYSEVFQIVLDAPQPDFLPLDWKYFRADGNFRQKGDGWLPRGLKYRIKSLFSTIRR